MPRWYYFLITIIPIVVFLFFPKWLVDDSYIYFRYAANLAHTGAPVWNIGEVPVEGYTGIAWLFMLAAGIKLGVSPLLAGHIFGVASYFLSFILLFLIFRRLNAEKSGTIIALLLYSTMPVLFTHALSGLETMLFFALLLGSIYVALSLRGTHQGWREALFFIVLFLLSLVRPEGIAFGGILALSIGYVSIVKTKKSFFGYVMRFLILFCLPLTAYFLWRHGYYGHWLPNTFYAKTNVGFTGYNLADLFRFLRSYFAVPVAACVLVLLPEIDSVWVDLKNFFKIGDGLRLATALAGFLFMGVLTVQFLHAHLTMNYAYRFYIPFLPFIFIAVGVLFGMGWKTFKESKNIKPFRFKFGVLLLLFLAGYQLFFHLTKLREEIKFAREEQASLVAQHIAIGKWLKTVVPPEEWLVAYVDAGAVPYFSELKTIDFGALNDPILANSSLSSADRVNYFFLHNPGAAVFTSLDAEVLDYGSEAAAITSDSRFKRYTLVKKYLSPLMPPRNYYEFVYLRSDLLKH